VGLLVWSGRLFHAAVSICSSLAVSAAGCSGRAYLPEGIAVAASLLGCASSPPHLKRQQRKTVMEHYQVQGF